MENFVDISSLAQKNGLSEDLLDNLEYRDKKGGITYG